MLKILSKIIFRIKKGENYHESSLTERSHFSLHIIKTSCVNEH